MIERNISLLLAYQPGIGARTLLKLRALGLTKLSNISESNLLKLNINEKTIRLIKNALTVNPDKYIQQLNHLGIKFSVLGDEDYPNLLAEINDPPNLLFYRGNLDSLQAPTVAIVGSRKASSYGILSTKKITIGLAQAGVSVISGLALGIDGVAHQSAIETEGNTVAVLANGLDQVYPSTHTNLAKKIISSGGAIVGEYPPGTMSFPSNFPVRNRIIAGLSKVVVVIEATKKSGSLITASAATQYNRDVACLPHQIFDPSGEGPNQLIRLGANLIRSSDDILDMLGITNKKKQSTIDLPTDSKLEKMILDTLNKEPKQIDEIINLLGLTSAELNATIALLEMKDRIRHLGGNYYARIY